MAFDAETGAVAWSVQNFDNGYSSPTLVTVDGKEQLIVIVSDRVAGLDPADGRLLWEHSHPTMFNVNASTPIWCGDNVLFAASAYGSGARGLKLSRDGDATSVKELWRQRKMEIHFGTPLLIGDHVYASIGDNGPTFFAAVNVKTGEMAWRKRGLLAKASGIVVGNRLILIDEDGKLLLAKPSPDDIEIISEAQVFESRSWTLPTLVGTTLYLRNLESIVALDIG
jgi:outer membrane protein assembly factor BamB